MSRICILDAGGRFYDLLLFLPICLNANGEAFTGTLSNGIESSNLG